MNVINPQDGQQMAVDSAWADVYVKWPDGRIIRPKIVQRQDIHSGRVLGWTLSPVQNGGAA